MPKVVNNGEIGFDENPRLAYEILARMTDAVSVPVTVKFRAGWDSEHINAEEMAVLWQKGGRKGHPAVQTAGQGTVL